MRNLHLKNDSSLKVRSLDWLHLESSCVYTTPTCNWCALGVPDLKRNFLFVAQAGKWPYLLQVLHWNFLEGHLKPSMCLESPHFEHLSLLWCAWLGSNLFLWGGMLWLCSPEYLVWLFDLDLWKCCFCLVLLGGRSVLWCLIRFTSAAWGSLATHLICLAVDFEDFIFLASCLTFLTGNFSGSILESFMVLETNSSSFRKNIKYPNGRY